MLNVLELDRPNLLALHEQLFPNNTTEDIKPVHLRQGLAALIYSAVLKGEGLSVNQLRGGTHIKATIAARNAIPASLRVVGMSCIVADPTISGSLTSGPETAPVAATFVLAQASNGSYVAYADADSQVEVRASWVLATGTDTQKLASYPELNPQQAYKKGDPIQYTFLGGVVRLFKARKDLSPLVPAPTGLDNDVNWIAFAPLASASAYSDAQAIAAVLAASGRGFNELVLPQAVVGGKWYTYPSGIWEARSSFSTSAAPVAGPNWRLVVAFSSYGDAQAVAAVVASGQLASVNDIRIVGAIAAAYVLPAGAGPPVRYATAQAAHDAAANGDRLAIFGYHAGLIVTKNVDVLAFGATFGGEISFNVPGSSTSVKSVWRGGYFTGRVVVVHPDSGSQFNDIQIEDLRGAGPTAYIEHYALLTTSTGLDKISLKRVFIKSGFSAANGAGAVLLRQRNEPYQACLLTVEDCDLTSENNAVFTGGAHADTRIELRGNNRFSAGLTKPLQAIVRLGGAAVADADILVDKRGAADFWLLSAGGVPGRLTFDGTALLLNGNPLGGATVPTGPPEGFTGAEANGDGTWTDIPVNGSVQNGLTIPPAMLADGGSLYFPNGGAGNLSLLFYGQQCEVYGVKFPGGGPSDAYYDNVRKTTISNNDSVNQLPGDLLYTFQLAALPGVHTAEVRRAGELGNFIVSRFRIK